MNPTAAFHSHVDRVAHSGVQPWSQGSFFPGTITRVETYCDPFVKHPDWRIAMRETPLEHRLIQTQWLARWGAEERLCDSYDEAEQYLLTQKEFAEEDWHYASQRDYLGGRTA